jgi:rod shape-determining protein MreB
MAVTALGGLVVAHSIRVGGYELDEAIVRDIQAQHKLLIGQEQAEALKLEIGSAFAGVEVPATADVAGRDLVTGLLRRVSIDAELVRRALARPLDQIVSAVEDLLERTPPELASDVADRGLMLVGGGALLRGFDELLRRRTGLHVTIADDPLTTVARGAAEAFEFSSFESRVGRKRRERPRFGA